MKKKMLVAAMALCAMMVLSSFTVMAQPLDSNETLRVTGSTTIPEGWNDSAEARLLMERFERERGRPRERDERVRALSAFSTVRVNVHVVVDQLWVERQQRLGNSYRFEAIDTVFDAGDIYWRRYSIDIRGNTLSRWNSHNTTTDANFLLLDAIGRHGLGGNGNRMMAAFTARPVLVYGGINVDGVARPNSWGTLITDRGWRTNNVVQRHEFGHNYGLPDHRDNTTRCFMNINLMHRDNNFDNICNNCNNTVTRNRTRF